jgi:PAS domain S-box-containing protein
MDHARPADLAALIVEQTVDAVVYADAEGFVRLWNPAATALFGFTAEEALGASLDLIIPERLRDAHWRGFRAAVRSGATRLGGRATLTKALRKSGQSLYVEMSFSLVKDGGGRVLGSVAIARDATEKQRQAREAAAP